MDAGIDADISSLAYIECFRTLLLDASGLCCISLSIELDDKIKEMCINSICAVPIVSPKSSVPEFQRHPQQTAGRLMPWEVGFHRRFDADALAQIPGIAIKKISLSAGRPL
jgi:hypothetical protein